MGTFEAGLRTIGDVKALPATIELSEGQLHIAAGDTEIGSWALSEIHLEEIPTGYRMAAEGEQILIELNDMESFTAELNSGNKRRLGFGRKRKRATQQDSEEPVREDPPTQVRVDPQPPSSPTKEPIQKSPSSRPKKRKQRPSGWTEKGLAFVDGTLGRANKRFGSFLPEWVFTRAMFLIAFVALILLVVFPGLVSTFLLVAGGLMILFGAVVYSDSLLASRWLPGRTTPQHVLLFGLAILMLGVLLGLVAR